MEGHRLYHPERWGRWSTGEQGAERYDEARRRKMQKAGWLLSALLLCFVLGGSAERAFGSAAGDWHHPWVVRPVLRVRGAFGLCRSHPRARFQASVQGYFLRRSFPPSGGRGEDGALFDQVVPRRLAKPQEWPPPGGLDTLLGGAMLPVRESFLL